MDFLRFRKFEVFARATQQLLSSVLVPRAKNVRFSAHHYSELDVVISALASRRKLDVWMFYSIINLNGLQERVQRLIIHSLQACESASLRKKMALQIILRFSAAVFAAFFVQFCPKFRVHCWFCRIFCAILPIISCASACKIVYISEGSYWIAMKASDRGWGHFFPLRSTFPTELQKSLVRSKSQYSAA